MSFSSQIKDELCHLPARSPAAARAELFASIASIGSITLSRGAVSLKLSFENLHAARRIYMLMTEHFGAECDIRIVRSSFKNNDSYVLSVAEEKKVTALLTAVGFNAENLFFLSSTPTEAFIGSEETVSGFLRGLFLSCGSVTQPKKNYHAEFIVSKEDFGVFILNILKKAGLSGKILFRKASFVVYLKGGDNIASLLAAMGASGAVLEFENVRVLKEMRNNVNRAVNCETANISKTVDAAARQIRSIKKIEAAVGLKSLGASLCEAAVLRLDNPDASLSELAEKYGMTKSGINHKMRKICMIADELNNKEDKT